ncbi:hypothetical protein [Flavobacterium cellulosilyticum]|uniref:Uncharacterized protein n=1 Tax=Flavobacterium cellulosilyticum TaxID=2541731 RepID=A0A4R5CBM4_9FLAO|nr:hypothetical protein [Flavobacterium cellulosilyticum]TDD97358.1 hypothetical protein E0F76_08560 [Flavobacterium cellulosilyticum]
MELNKIKLLLDKYFLGDTSIAEEIELKDYFSSSEISPELEQYQSLFVYFSNEETKIFKPEIQIQSNSRNLKWQSIAASILILLGIGTYGYFNFDTKNQNQDLGTFDKPEVAFKATQKALLMLSTQINTGYESMLFINEYEYSKNLIFKQD